MNNALLDGCRKLVGICADVSAGDKVLIISDASTRHLGILLAEAVLERSKILEHLTIDGLSIHGSEPPSHVAERMTHADVIFSIASMSIAHTNARLISSKNGAKFLSLPQYSEQVLLSKALQFDFRTLTEPCVLLAATLTEGKEIFVSTAKGTHLNLQIEGRQGNAAPGWCYAPEVIASPPDAEVNVAVVESGTNGVVVVDGSIPHPLFGILEEPIKLIISNGIVEEISGPRSEELWKLFHQAGDPAARVVAEFGVGMNPFAKLTGSMLEDEGTLGTIHLGIGSNVTIGGKNKVSFHLDHVIRDPTFRVDSEIIMNNGKFQSPRLTTLMD